MAERWADSRMVFVHRPACPRCGEFKYRKIRTHSDGDGAIVKRVVCKSRDDEGNEIGCGLRYRICLLSCPDSAGSSPELSDQPQVAIVDRSSKVASLRELHAKYKHVWDQGNEDD